MAGFVLRPLPRTRPLNKPNMTTWDVPCYPCYGLCRITAYVEAARTVDTDGLSREYPSAEVDSHMSDDGAVADSVGNQGRIHIARGLDHSIDQQRFIERLNETIFWCTYSGSLAEPRTSLRTCEPDRTDLASQDRQVFKVSLERSNRLRSTGKNKLSSSINLCGGRLLAYFPNDNLFDGVAEVESDGFFDVDNIPPYDTWV